jgi:hypothetical protein
VPSATKQPPRAQHSQTAGPAQILKSQTAKTCTSFPHPSSFPTRKEMKLSFLTTRLRVVRWGRFAIYLLRDSQRPTPGSGTAAGSIMVLAVDRVTDVPARTAGKKLGNPRAAMTLCWMPEIPASLCQAPSESLFVEFSRTHRVVFLLGSIALTRSWKR